MVDLIPRFTANLTGPVVALDDHPSLCRSEVPFPLWIAPTQYEGKLDPKSFDHLGITTPLWIFRDTPGVPDISSHLLTRLIAKQCAVIDRQLLVTVGASF
jgi:hypothetical protein